MKHLSMVLCLVLFVATGTSARARYIRPDGTGDAPAIGPGVVKRTLGPKHRAPI